jgi:hypothetical protein
MPGVDRPFEPETIGWTCRVAPGIARSHFRRSRGRCSCRVSRTGSMRWGLHYNNGAVLPRGSAIGPPAGGTTTGRRLWPTNHDGGLRLGVLHFCGCMVNTSCKTLSGKVIFPRGLFNSAASIFPMQMGVLATARRLLRIDRLGVGGRGAQGRHSELKCCCPPATRMPPCEVMDPCGRLSPRCS